jgi:prevent-host-death family protein
MITNIIDNLDSLAYYDNMTWQLQEAKNKLSQVVDLSLSDGPQIISRRGKNTAVVLSYGEYKQITSRKKSVKEAIMAMDLSQLDLTRDKSPTGRATPINFNE